MSHRTIASVLMGGLALALNSGAFAGVPPFVISEIRTGQPGPDLDEYVEIRGTPGASLNGLTYLVIGDDDLAFPPAQNGTIELAIHLDGLVIPASGYFVMAKSTFTLGTPTVVAPLNFEDNDNTTHMLVSGFSGSVGTDVDTDDNGVIDFAPWTGIVSDVALVLGPSPDGISTDFYYSSNTVGPDGGNVPSHVYRCENSAEYRVGEADPSAGDDTVGAANPTCSSTGPSLRISELRIDQTGSDNDEYFELEGPAGMDLSAYTYIVIGDGTASQGTGVIEAVVSLAGQSMPGDGYFLCTETTFTLHGAVGDLVVGAAGLNFENNDNVTHMLVKDFTGALNTDLDADNDGVLDSTPWSELTDAVGLDTGAAGEFLYTTTIVGPDGGFVPSHVYRCSPYGDWKMGTFDPATSVDTPGIENFICPTCGGSGSCFVAHATPGCDVVDCCSLVCAVDPTCCTTEWDAACVKIAGTQCQATGAAPAVTINELRIGQSGADTDEYIEIKGAPGTNLKGVAYVVIGDGSDANGVVESVALLDGTIPADGFFVVAKSTFTLGSPDLIRESMNLEDGDTTTHLLVWNFNGALGADLDANNDCVLDSTAWASTIDGVVLTNGTGCGYATATVGPDASFSPSHAYLCEPDQTWVVGLFDSLANDTPGATNAACPPPDPCGTKGSGDCYTSHATPGCQDADCCHAICAADPSCCEVEWDTACAKAAFAQCFVPPSPPAVVLSEIRTDQTGTDNDEYFEIKGEPGTVLSGLTYVVIGDGTSAQGSGVVEMALSLDGQVIPADGFFLAAKSTFTLDGATPDWVIPSGLFFENSDNVTHMLVWQFTGATGTDLDTNDDGVLDATPWTSVVQSVSLVLSTTVPPPSSEWFYSTTTVGPDGVFVPSHVKYCPSTGTWTMGTFDPTTSDDTPGVANDDCVYTNPCPADLDHDGMVSASDLAILLGGWGTTGATDLDGSGITNAADLAVLLGAWGACP